MRQKKRPNGSHTPLTGALPYVTRRPGAPTGRTPKAWSNALGIKPVGTRQKAQRAVTPVRRTWHTALRGDGPLHLEPSLMEPRSQAAPVGCRVARLRGEDATSTQGANRYATSMQLIN